MDTTLNTIKPVNCSYKRNQADCEQRTEGRLGRSVTPFNASKQAANKSSVSFCSTQDNQSSAWLIDNIGYVLITSSVAKIGAFVSRNLYELMIKGEETDTFKNVNKTNLITDEMMTHFHLKDVHVEINKPLKEIFKNSSNINAFYLSKALENRGFLKDLNINLLESEKSLALAPSEMPSLIFHELGHAVIDKTKPFLSFLQNHSAISKKILPWAWIVLPIISNVARSQQIKDKDSKTSKILNFIHNHVGAIVFLTFIPQLISEGMASYYGIKLANFAKKAGTLEKKDVDLLYKRYPLAFGTYLAAAAVASLSIKGYEVFRDKVFGYSPKTQDNDSQQTSQWY